MRVHVGPRTRLALAAADDAKFAGAGRLVFRALAKERNSLQWMRLEGADRHSVLEPVIDLISVSPDGHWALAARPSSHTEAGPNPSVYLFTKREELANLYRLGLE